MQYFILCDNPQGRDDFYNAEVSKLIIQHLRFSGQRF